MKSSTLNHDVLLNTIFGDTSLNLNHPYFREHLITYLGNKRSLLPFIQENLIEIKRRLGKEKLFIIDGFSGSGSVSRMFLMHAHTLISNDFETYTSIINRAYLSRVSDVDSEELTRWITYINKNKLKPRTGSYFISNNYAPKNDQAILTGERVFYTATNAKIIDNIRDMLHTEVPEDVREYLMANLLVKASIHTNTSGVFKGFHKKNGIGHFGGKGENALSRIKKEISLDFPILINHDCNVIVENKDTNELVRAYKDQQCDVVYYDPPYNQHPYGSNYFMLNIIASQKDPEIQDGVSGIIKDWNRSAYNKQKQAETALDDLIQHTNSKYILISYNNEGIIPENIFKKTLMKYGAVELKKQSYNTYRGSRNLKERNNKVEELLWILEKNNPYTPTS